MDNKKQALAKAIVNDFRKKNNRDPKDEKELTLFVQEQGGEKYLAKLQEKLTAAALHGAKLQYIKSLKNQCPEGEELYYFKKGGSVGCGCKKKEDGGEIASAKKGTVVDKFKKMKSGKKITPQINPSDTVHVNGIAYSVTNSDGSPVDKRFKPYSGKVEEEDRKKAKKGDKDALKRQLKQDLASSEKCGGKVKKHQYGSQLDSLKNSIKFTPKIYDFPVEVPFENAISEGLSGNGIMQYSWGPGKTGIFRGSYNDLKNKYGKTRFYINSKGELFTDSMGRNPFVGFKKKGGSLNGIPFMQTGTNKFGIKPQSKVINQLLLDSALWKNFDNYTLLKEDFERQNAIRRRSFGLGPDYNKLIKIREAELRYKNPELANKIDSLFNKYQIK